MACSRITPFSTSARAIDQRRPRPRGGVCATFLSRASVDAVADVEDGGAVGELAPEDPAWHWVIPFRVRAVTGGVRPRLPAAGGRPARRCSSSQASISEGTKRTGPSARPRRRWGSRPSATAWYTHAWLTAKRLASWRRSRAPRSTGGVVMVGGRAGHGGEYRPAPAASSTADLLAPPFGRHGTGWRGAGGGAAPDSATKLVPKPRLATPALLETPKPASTERVSKVRWRGLEPPRPIRATRPSTLRVYQFRHQRVRCDPGVYRLAAAPPPRS